MKALSMKALSIRQPWASLIIIGAKSIETRSRKTRHRGPLLIHASQTFGASERHFARTTVALTALERAQLTPDELPLGAILGVVDVDDCQPVEAWLATFKGIAGTRERMLGDYAPGRWGWHFANVRALRTPIVTPGALSLWNYPVFPDP